MEALASYKHVNPSLPLCPETASSSMVLLCEIAILCALCPHSMDVFFKFFSILHFSNIKSNFFSVHSQLWKPCVHAGALQLIYHIILFMLCSYYTNENYMRPVRMPDTTLPDISCFLFAHAVPTGTLGWNPADALTALPTSSSSSPTPLPLGPLTQQLAAQDLQARLHGIMWSDSSSTVLMVL